jgi:hypothetical protein
MGGQGRCTLSYAAQSASMRAWQAEDTLAKVLGEIGYACHGVA